MFDYFLRPKKVSVFGRERDLTDNSVIIPCGFGRKTWDDAEVSNSLAPIMAQLGHLHMDPERFQILQSVDFDAGSVNRALANICYQLANAYRTGNQAPYRVVGQWEVMYELWKQHPEWYREHQQWFLTTIWPRPDGEYLSTRGMFELVRLTLNQNVVIVAQAVHMARCLRVADQVFGHDNVSKAPVAMPNFYDEDSVQLWTRDQASFVAWERKARVFDEMPGWMRSLVRHFI